jgi:hypothetical protein
MELMSNTSCIEAWAKAYVNRKKDSLADEAQKVRLRSSLSRNGISPWWPEGRGKVAIDKAKPEGVESVGE